MNYDAMTLLDLKKLCKERGLKVSGRKDEVVIRLWKEETQVFKLWAIAASSERILW